MTDEGDESKVVANSEPLGVRLVLEVTTQIW